MDGKNRITIAGNPNLSNVRTIMIGIRNRSKTENNLPDDGLPKCAIIWVDELRLSDFDEKGGWAANTRVTTKLADLGIITLSGLTSTPGFGGIESTIDDRSKETVYEYDISSNFELGKFFPQKSGIKIPMYYGFSQTIKNPQYDPLDPDVLFSVTLNDPNISKAEKVLLKKRSPGFC